jgi:hypothetical protein
LELSCVDKFNTDGCCTLHCAEIVTALCKDKAVSASCGASRGYSNVWGEIQEHEDPAHLLVRAFNPGSTMLVRARQQVLMQVLVGCAADGIREAIICNSF